MVVILVLPVESLCSRPVPVLSAVWSGSVCADCSADSTCSIIQPRLPLPTPPLFAPHLACTCCICIPCHSKESSNSGKHTAAPCTHSHYSVSVHWIFGNAVSLIKLTSLILMLKAYFSFILLINALKYMECEGYFM